MRVRIMHMHIRFHNKLFMPIDTVLSVEYQQDEICLCLEILLSE